MTPAFNAYDSTLAMVHALADEVAGRLGGALASRGGASLVVTGGTTAGPLYDRLCRARLAWDRIFVTLSDERWVATGSPDANETLVRERLLVNNAERARFTPLKIAAKTAAEAETKVNWMIAAMRKPFDVTLLGMGADGHVASLFTGGEGVERAMDLNDPALVRAVRYDRAAGATERMTLTLRALLESRFIVIMIRGADKRAAYERALTAPADAHAAPVRAILHQDAVRVGVYWAP
ncbi:MAG TPA: 6-phosphogluconolactonase [Caulobacteraceae bacterium]|jgi:6-phosphogluconolactonase